MARVLLWIFTAMSYIGWVIGEEHFLVFYALFSLLVFTETIRRIALKKGADEKCRKSTIY